MMLPRIVSSGERLAPFGLEVQAHRRPALKSRAAPAISAGMKARDAKFALGQVVKHRVFPFRGVIFDVDPEFSNTEEWWQAIPAEIRPRKDQPFYHLLAENAESEYIAYVSEQNLLPDTSGEPLRHPQIADVFDRDDRGGYRMRMQAAN
jgi:heat shock protein HspQ